MKYYTVIVRDQFSTTETMIENGNYHFVLHVCEHYLMSVLFNKFYVHRIKY